MRDKSTFLPHPAKLLNKIGITDRLSGIAIVCIAVLQYLFLAKLWEGYLIRYMGDFVHPYVVWTGMIVSCIGVAVIAYSSLTKWSVGNKSAIKLEKPATHESFQAIQKKVTKIGLRAELEELPVLYYTPKNSDALQVRDSIKQPSRLIVGLNQRRANAIHPDAFEAQIGHEISHLELGETKKEVRTRLLLSLHIKSLSLLVIIYLVALGFIDTLGVDYNGKLGGLAPTFTYEVYRPFQMHAIPLALSTIVIYVYTVFFLVRREHAHDIRGSMLAGNNVLADSVFEPNSRKETFFSKINDFFGLHPSYSSRAQIVLNKDYILLSIVLYPLIVAGIQPLVLLLTAGWDNIFDIETNWWNLKITTISALFLFMILRADVVRIGLDWLINRPSPNKILFYVFSAGLATQLPRLIMQIVHGMRHEIPVSGIAFRFVDGLVHGGGKVILLLACVLVLCSYLCSVRLAAFGEQTSYFVRSFESIFVALIIVVGYMISSLTSISFLGMLIFLLCLLSVVYLVVLIIFSDCKGCGKKRKNSVFLHSRCSCGLSSHGIEFADLNNDGKLDLIISHLWPICTGEYELTQRYIECDSDELSTPGVEYRLNEGVENGVVRWGSLQTVPGAGLPNVINIEPFDFDNDGDIDIYAAVSRDRDILLRNNLIPDGASGSSVPFDSPSTAQPETTARRTMPKRLI